MSIVVPAGCTVLGVVAGVPATGLILAFPVPGHVAFPQRWLFGGGAPRILITTVSAAAGVSTGTVATRIGWSPDLPVFLLAAILGVVLAAVDVRQERLPYHLSAPVYGAAALCFVVQSFATGDFRSLINAAVAGAVVALAFLGLALALPGQLGLGDVVLVGWIAFTLGWLGWHRLAFGLIAGLLLQAALSVLMILKRGRRRNELPMGPALLIGWLAAVALG